MRNISQKTRREVLMSGCLQPPPCALFSLLIVLTAPPRFLLAIRFLSFSPVVPCRFASKDILADRAPARKHFPYSTSAYQIATRDIPYRRRLWRRVWPNLHLARRATNTHP